MCISANAQEFPMESVERAIKSGDAGALSAYFNNTIDITLNNNQSSYSATQAELVMRDYFRKNRVRDFSFKRVSTPSPANTVYAIGTLMTRTGMFKVYVYMKQVNKQAYLQQIKIEK